MKKELCAAGLVLGGLLIAYTGMCVGLEHKIDKKLCEEYDELLDFEPDITE